MIRPAMPDAELLSPLTTLRNATPADNELLSPLDSIGEVGHGPEAYYRKLVQTEDLYLQTAGWNFLIEAGAVEPSRWDAVVEAAAAAGSTKTRAFEYFETIFEHQYALKCATLSGDSLDEIRRSAMLAKLNFDHLQAVQARGRYFLETGETGHLVNAAECAELAAGWRAAVPWSARALASAPMVADLAGMLYLLLAESRQADLVDELTRRLEPTGLHRELGRVFAAASSLIRGDASGCLSALYEWTDEATARVPALVPLRGKILHPRAEALDALGRYSEAFLAFRAMNEAERSEAKTAESFLAGLRARASLSTPVPLVEPREDVVLMLGFPRSGTTLLENALAAHPEIETFEEIASHQAAVERLSRELQRGTSVTDAFQAARSAYYYEIDVRRTRPEARILVDKLPLLSAEATFIRRVVPNRRYIFSVRHPFDVALSCFKQRFAPNEAMDSFRTIEQTVRLYDYAMNEWFANFSMDSAAVCYVRYDDLVTAFVPTTSRVLSFLGLDWDASVATFAETAETRSARTPSYAKVRQGLSIGVQTAWRNYDFLFNTPEAKPLHKWAEFFGYPTT